MQKRFLSFLLAAMMCVGLLPTAFAADAGITAGTTDLTVASSESGEKTSVVAFGGHEWYVIGYDGSGINSTEDSVTLLAKDSDFGYSAFRAGSVREFENSSQYSDNHYYANNPDESKWTTPNEYAGSTLQQAMTGDNGVLSKFSAAEQGLIIARDLSDVSVTNQKVWPLSINEWIEIKNEDVLSYGNYFWLRDASYYGYSVGYQALVGGPTGTDFSYVDVYSDEKETIRPALSLNLSSVLFTSDSTGKSAAAGSVTEVTAPTGTVKYTFQSSDQDLTVDSVTETETGLAVSYSDATTGENQYVSFVLKNAEGDVVYYGKIADCASSGGGTAVSIPLTGVADGSYTLSIFSEQANGDLYSDFASEPYETAIEVKNGTASLPRYTIEIPVTVNVELGGSASAAESFYAALSFPVEDMEIPEELEDEFSIEIEPIATNGKGTYTGTVKITYTENTFPFISDGMYISQENNGTDGWTYDDAEYVVFFEPDDDGTYGVSEYYLLPSTSGPVSADEEMTPTPAEAVQFTNTYTAYTITASAGEGGSISPDGSVTAVSGSDKGFAITSASGYKIEDVKVDGTSVGAVSSYTFENVQADHTIAATFTAVSTDNPTDPKETGVNDLLENGDHIAYLFGYPDGSFQPDGNMTRAEAAQMFYNLLKNQNVTITTGFSDVADDAWYAKAVNTLASLNLVSGVGGGKFEPDRAITRAEFTKMAMSFARLNEGGTNIFTDVNESDWFYETVVGSIQYGWIDGYSDGTFRPNNTITRAEVATIVNRMLTRSADKDYVDANADSLKSFPDVTTEHWAYYDIVEATNAHDYTSQNSTETWTGLRNN